MDASFSHRGGAEDSSEVAFLLSKRGARLVLPPSSWGEYPAAGHSQDALKMDEFPPWQKLKCLKCEDFSPRYMMIN